MTIPARTSLTSRLAAALLLSSACSTTATIKRVGGPNLEATIVGSDSESVHVRTELGRVYAVPRRQVRHIEHPGSVMLVTGLGLLVPPAAFLLDESPHSREEWTAMGALMALPGVLLAAGGLYQWMTSRFTADDFDVPSLRVEPIPPDLVLDRGTPSIAYPYPLPVRPPGVAPPPPSPPAPAAVAPLPAPVPPATAQAPAAPAPSPPAIAPSPPAAEEPYGD
jgi:hypothetical protein